MGARDHAFDDAENALGESEVRCPNQIRGVDARRKTTAAGILGITRRQGRAPDNKSGLTLRSRESDAWFRQFIGRRRWGDFAEDDPDPGEHEARAKERC